ncbi:hypothetical protein NRP93_002572 [Clostridium botulinum]|nr:hypothetical protein [Clostridium botulinum]
MIITGKKVGIFVGFLAVLITLIMLIGNILFNKNFSYTAIGLGSICGAMLLFLSAKK